MKVPKSLRAWLARFNWPAARTDRNAPGKTAQIYAYTQESPGEKSRIHLRIDPDGSGLLLVNANRVLHLNASAAFMARLALEGTPPEAAVRHITGAFHTTAAQAGRDYQEFQATLAELVRPDGACPIHDLDLEISAPFSSRPSAPYRLDLALTYQCNNDCAHCYNARPRDMASLSTHEWKAILDRAWQIGIPHVVFTGGEPTLFPDLSELIAHAEHNGQITGLNTNGRRLGDCDYLSRLIDAGLDHVQITLESHDPAIHDHMVRLNGAWKQTVAGIRNVLDTPLYVMTNTTMLQDNASTLDQTLDYLAELGLPTVGLNALIYSGRGKDCGRGLPEAQLTPLLKIARSKTEAHGQRLIWYTPTQYCGFDPNELELGVKGCTAARYNLCIEPDGAVLPCQSYYEPIGNLLTDRWKDIWNHPLALRLRERQYLHEPAWAMKCSGCALASECGGGCPLTPA